MLCGFNGLRVDVRQGECDQAKQGQGEHKTWERGRGGTRGILGYGRREYGVRNETGLGEQRSRAHSRQDKTGVEKVECNQIRHRRGSYEEEKGKEVEKARIGKRAPRKEE